MSCATFLARAVLLPNLCMTPCSLPHTFLQVLRTAAGNLFEYKLDVSGSGIVSVREIMSHFRFGFGAASGVRRPFTPVPAELASDSLRNVMSSYEDGLPSPRLSPRSRPVSRSSSNLEPLNGALTSSWSWVSASSWTRGVDKDVSLSQAHSPMLHRSLSQGDMKPEAALRHLSARLGKIRVKAAAHLEQLNDGKGKVGKDSLVESLQVLGSMSRPQVTLSRAELIGALELFAEDESGKIGLRGFSRSLFRGKLLPSLPRLPLSDNAEQQSEQRPCTAGDMTGASVEGSAAVHVSPTSGRSASPDVSSENVVHTEHRQPLPSGTLRKKLMKAKTLSHLFVTPEMKWWRATGRDECEDAAIHLLDALRQSSASGSVGRDEFRSVMQGLGILNEDEAANIESKAMSTARADALFGACVRHRYPT